MLTAVIKAISDNFQNPLTNPVLFKLKNLKIVAILNERSPNQNTIRYTILHVGHSEKCKIIGTKNTLWSGGEETDY